MVSDGFIHQERRWVGAGRNDCVAENGMVASKHPLIGEAGVSVMRKGGNAVDAPRITRETGTVYLDSRYPAAVRDRLTSMGHDINWIDPELKSWGRPIAVMKDRDTGMLHGGVYSMLTGFESMAVGF